MLYFQTDSSIARNRIHLTFENMRTVDNLLRLRATGASRYLFYQNESNLISKKYLKT